jgi:hypothetical protein
MAPTPINRKHLIFEDEKSPVLKNNTMEEIAASHGITKQILTIWLMSQGGNTENRVLQLKMT